MTLQGAGHLLVINAEDAERAFPVPEDEPPAVRRERDAVPLVAGRELPHPFARRGAVEADALVQGRDDTVARCEGRAAELEGAALAWFEFVDLPLNQVPE